MSNCKAKIQKLNQLLFYVEKFVILGYGNKYKLDLYNIMRMEKLYLKYYGQYKDKIYNYFYYRLNFNRALAEDMTQDVFLKAFDKFDTFDPARPFQAWIYRIAKNHLLNHYRVQGREVCIDNICEPGVCSMGRIEARLELEKVLETVMKMPEPQKDVLILRYIDGLENGEIAEVLEIEEGAARTRISRALKNLRENLYHEKSGKKIK